METPSHDHRQFGTPTWLPDWKFDRLREQYPDGDYEAGANIGPDE